MASHSSGFYFIIVGCFLLFLCYVVFEAVALTTLFDVPNAILPNDPFVVYFKYPLSYDVMEWFQFLRIPIIIWDFLWLSYGLGTLCRRDLATGNYLYYSPQFFPIVAYASFGTAMLSSVAVTFTTSYHYLGFALGFQALAAFCLYLALWFASRGLYSCTDQLVATGQQREVSFMHGLVLNGLGFHLSYLDFFVALNLSKVLVYRFEVDEEIAGLIGLGIYVAFVFVFFLLEISVWDKYVRNVVSYYVMGLVVSLSVFMRSYYFAEAPSAVAYLIIALVAVHALAIVAKFLNMCLRGRVAMKYGRKPT